MKYLVIAFLLILNMADAHSQLLLPPSGGNQKSVITQYMGAHASVTIEYNSPDVTGPNGEDRKGKIWGQLVPYGLTNLNFGISTDDNPSPWRAGANENTTIRFSHDVKVQGKNLKAGKYGLHIIPREHKSWILIFSNNSSAWGSYYYRPEEDALRVEITPETAPYHEWLSYEFTDRKEESCVAALMWEYLSLPFKIELQKPKEIYVEYLRKQMQSSAGFNWASRNAAANYCLQNEVNLKEAYGWQKLTSTNSFMGRENVTTLSTLAGIELKLGKEKEAMATFERAANLPGADIMQVHQLGRQLITLGQPDTALKIFKLNLQRHGDVWPVNVGLARGYSATGEFDKALKHARIAYERAPDQLNKDSLREAIEKLERKEDIN